MSIQEYDSTTLRSTKSFNTIVVRSGEITSRIPVRVPFVKLLSPEARLIARRRLCGIMTFAIATWFAHHPKYMVVKNLFALMQNPRDEVFDWANVLSSSLSPSQASAFHDYIVSVIPMLENGCVIGDFTNHLDTCVRRVDYSTLNTAVWEKFPYTFKGDGVGHEA